MGCKGSLGKQRGGWPSFCVSFCQDYKLICIGFRWLFFIEGSLTIVIAFLAIFILPDFPLTTRWLSPSERKLAVRRMEEDGGLHSSDQELQGPRNIRNSGFVQAMTDWKVWWLALALTSEVVALSFNAFFPTLTATLGFNTTITLILAAPPWIVTAFIAFFVTR